MRKLENFYSSPINCYLSVVEGFAFYMTLRAVPSGVFYFTRATDGGKVEGEK